MPIDLSEQTPHVEDPNADEVSYNIDTATWGEEDSWFDWNQEPWTYPYQASQYSSTFSAAFKAADFKSPYYYKSALSSVSDSTNETYRVQWRGLFAKDYYFGSPPPASVADLPIKADKAIETKQWPTPWGFGIKSPMSNIFTVLPGYSSSGYDPGNKFPEVDAYYFYTSFANKFGKNLYSFPNSDDWGTELDTSKTGKPMPFVPLFMGSVSPPDTIQYTRRDFKGTSSSGSVFTTYPNYVPLSFNYQKIVVLPKVYAAKYDDTRDYGLEFAGPFTIPEYFDGVDWDPDTQTGTPPKKDTYPMITAVRIDTVYFGTTDGTSANRRTYISGGNLNAFLPDTLTLGGVPSTRIYKNGSYYLYHSSWGASNNADNWHPATGYVIDGGLISGMGQNYNNVFTFPISLNTNLTDLRKAYINQTQNEGASLPLFHQNGEYEIHCVQRHSNGGIKPENTMGMCALWKNPTKEKVMRDVAYLGFWFADDVETASTGFTGTECDSPKMHIPLFDEDGVTTGEWLSGPDAANADNAKWQDPFKSNPYNPNKPGPSPDPPGPGPAPTPAPPKPENNTGYRNTNDYRNVQFNPFNLYALTEAELQQFLDFVNGMYTDTTDPDAEKKALDVDFKGSNPMDYIIGLYGYPFTLQAFSYGNMSIGPVDTGITAHYIIPGQSGGAFHFGSIDINGYTNDFRDYPPYTSMELYVPFMGTVEIDPALYIGKKLGLDYVYDYYTGNAMAKIYVIDGDQEILDKTIDGSICVSLPVTATNMAQYQKSIHETKSTILGKVFDTVGSLSPSKGLKMAAASGNEAGVLGALPDLFEIGRDAVKSAYDISYEITHNQPKISVTGTSSPQLAINMSNTPVLLRKVANTLPGYVENRLEYSKTVGNATAESGRVNDFDGLIKVSDITFSNITATTEEINQITSILKKGLIINTHIN